MAAGIGGITGGQGGISGQGGSSGIGDSTSSSSTGAVNFGAFNAGGYTPPWVKFAAIAVAGLIAWKLLKK